MATDTTAHNAIHAEVPVRSYQGTHAPSRRQQELISKPFVRPRVAACYSYDVLFHAGHVRAISLLLHLLTQMEPTVLAGVIRYMTGLRDSRRLEGPNTARQCCGSNNTVTLYS